MCLVILTKNVKDGEDGKYTQQLQAVTSKSAGTTVVSRCIRSLFRHELMTPADAALGGASTGRGGRDRRHDGGGPRAELRS